MKRLLAIIALSFSCFSTLSAFGDTIFLDDGRVFEGTFLNADNDGFLFLIDGQKIYLPRSRISALDSQNGKLTLEATAPQARSRGHMVIHIEAAPSKPQPAETPVEVSYHGAPADKTVVKNILYGPAGLLPTDPRRLAQLGEWVQNLRLNAPASDQLESAYALAQSGNAGLAALAIYGLYNDLPSVREQSAKLLAKRGGLAALKALIEVFYAGAAETVPPYQVPFMEILSREISRLTGENFQFQTGFGGDGSLVARQMVAWWNDHFLSLPLQLGEPAISPVAPDYKEVMGELRKLTLVRREFGGFNPPNLAAPPAPNTPSEAQFTETFPEYPDALATSHEPPIFPYPAVPKEYSPTRDAPGEFRLKNMEDRLRLEVERMAQH
jgi:hypothetical protein